jgi:tellurium resistance protein TerD
MGINLQKGQRIDLTKGKPGLSKVIVGLGWDTNKYDGGSDFDLDAAAFLLTENGKVIQDTDFIFYNNLKHESGGVLHEGDNRTGEGEGDDERMLIDLAKIPEKYQKIAFTVTIYEADIRTQNFGQVSNAYIRIVDENTGEELLRFDLGEDYSIETALIVAELYRSFGEWKFNAIGGGFKGGLKALCDTFGVDA